MPLPSDCGISYCWWLSPVPGELEFGRSRGRRDAAILDELVVAWFGGRADFEKYHTRLLSGRFHESTLTLLETVVRFIRPDLALVHWSWRVHSDKNADGSARPPRFGLMTMFAERRKGTWLVVAAQNTNSLPVPPELQGIKPPIAVPPTEP